MALNRNSYCALFDLSPNDHVLSALFTAASNAGPCSPAHLDRVFAAMALHRAQVGQAAPQGSASSEATRLRSAV